MIAMALMNGPDVLVADEPPPPWTPRVQSQVLDLLGDVAARATAPPSC
ncbi:hypothetical protein [Kitasatospora albolonga]